MVRVPEPADGDERAILGGWLAFHRDAMAAKAAGLDADQLVERSCPPSPLSVLGLIRHITEMERVYGTYALGAPGELHFVYGEYTDDGPEWDIDADASMVADSLANWADERQAVDTALGGYASLDDIATGNRRTVRWNLQKLVGEYARHNGHADLLRERIDGATGE